MKNLKFILILLTFSSNVFADCANYVGDLINYAKSSSMARIKVSLTIKQGNGLSASSTPHLKNMENGMHVVELDWNGTWLTNIGSAGWSSPGNMLYSDRGNGYNPYPTNIPDTFDMYINNAGYVVIYNRTWGVWSSFSGDCSNNLLYGWGSPIGLNNGIDKALYVLSFKKISASYL